MAAALPLLNRPAPLHLEWVPPKMGEKGALKICSFNTLTTYVTDGKEKIREKYPQYQWEMRKRAFIELIAFDHPTVLALCELDLVQAKTLQEAMGAGGELEGYQLIGFASQTQRGIEETAKEFQPNEQGKYGELVAFLYDGRRLRLLEKSCTLLPEEAGQKWHRILVKALFKDPSTETLFACFSSHFDDKSRWAREKSAHVELQEIASCQQEGIPCFSMGDRNWYLGEDEEAPRPYLEQGLLDFRDGTLHGSFGPPGTFPGHPWLERDMGFSTINGVQIPNAWTVDTGYYSGATPLCYYTYAGEIDRDTGRLLPPGPSSTLCDRRFVSDHYYLGASFQLEKKREERRQEHMLWAVVAIAVVAIVAWRFFKK